MGEERRQIAPTKPTVYIDDILDIGEDGSTFRSLAASECEVYSFRFSLHTAIKCHELLGRAINRFHAGNQGAQGIRSGKR